MATKKKMLMSAAGNAGGGGLDITDVFSTYLYTGNGSTQTITNGIDLDGEGGLVWLKNRDAATNHRLYTTDLYSGSNSNLLQTNLTTGGSNTGAFELESFNSNGFTLGFSGGAYSESNGANTDYASWTFRKAPKFFDVVTYTGTGSAQNISHSLGSVPGMVIVKCTNTAKNWGVYHRGVGSTNYLQLNTTGDANINSGFWNDTDPTSTQFTLGNQSNVNGNGNTYVAYLFAHNDSGDGEFGPDGDQDIIKCGSYTGNESSFPTIDLGFEPQWVMIKAATRNSNWQIFDIMRGIATGSKDPHLWANTSDAEPTTGNDHIDLNPTGFGPSSVEPSTNSTGETFIYMAIRRGPLAVPEDATDVFGVDANGGTSSGNSGALTSGFPVDLAIYTQTTGGNKDIVSRINSTRLQTNLTNAENTSSRASQLDFMDGYGNGTFASDYVGWMWKRAPGFFDVVAYTGTGSSNAVAHNLTVSPEMLWIKHRSAAPYGNENWTVGVPTTNNPAKGLYLNTSSAFRSGNDDIESVSDSTFTVGSHPRSNSSGVDYIAYLFASVDNVSKVGSFSHTYGGTTNVDCGFTSGARFVLWKRTDGTRHWEVFDTTRGIVAGNDAYLRLSDTAAETSGDYIDPYSAGFSIGSALGTGEFIFYAIA